MPSGVYKRTKEFREKVRKIIKEKWKDEDYRLHMIKVHKGQQAGKLNNKWKGDNVGYSGIHRWLEKHFGKANKCEHPDCKGLSKNFNWALLHGKEYERKRENFWMLCISCHRKYDYKIKLLKNSV